ncbi:MAG: TolC family protein [Sediminibacterium sp.]
MRLLLTSIGFLFATFIQAQTYTLQEVEELSIKNYPLIKQAAILNQSANFNIDNIKKALYPQFSINGQATYQSEVTSINLPIAGFKPNPLSKDQYRATAELQQTIYDGGLNKKMQAVALAGAKLDIIKNEVDLYKLKERVTQIYCTVLYTNEVVTQIKLIQSDLENALLKIESLYKNGLVFKNNVLQIKAQLLKNSQKLEEAIAAKRMVLDALELLANQPIASNAIFVVPKDMQIDIHDLALSRPELLLFEAQKSSVEKQLGLVNAKTNPKLGAFVQGGYGRPGLNMLKNDFDWFSIGGIKLQWSLGGYYTAKKEKDILQNQSALIQNEKETYTLNNRVQLKQQLDEIAKIEKLIQSDKEIVALRDQIKNTSLVQLNNGVITANDYLREINEYDLANQSLVQHQTQLIQSKLQFQLIKGKN